MKNTILLSIIAIFLYSCSGKEKKVIAEPLFKISYHRLNIDTNIMHTQYHNGYCLLQLENDNYAVVDSNFNRHREFEQLLANTKTSYIKRC